jgi:hypothetical protein
MSLDMRQMFPRPPFCMHFRNNKFTTLPSLSILKADDGEDCGTTVYKEGKATNAFSICSHTASCSYHSPAAPTLREYVTVTITLQLPHSVPCSYHSPAAPHTQRGSCSYHSAAAPKLKERLAVNIRLQYSHSGLLLQLTFPFLIHRHSVSLL